MGCPDHGLGPPASGILWNLSSSDHLKDRLARDTLEQLTDLVLSPLSGAGGPPLIQQNASEAEIFYNATGFLRCAWQGPDHGHGERKSGCWGRLNDKAEPERGLGEVDRPSKAWVLMQEWDKSPGIASSLTSRGSGGCRFRFH